MPATRVARRGAWQEGGSEERRRLQIVGRCDTAIRVSVLGYGMLNTRVRECAGLLPLRESDAVCVPIGHEESSPPRAHESRRERRWIISQMAVPLFSVGPP